MVFPLKFFYMSDAVFTVMGSLFLLPFYPMVLIHFEFIKYTLEMQR